MVIFSYMIIENVDWSLGKCEQFVKKKKNDQHIFMHFQKFGNNDADKSKLIIMTVNINPTGD